MASREMLRRLFDSSKEYVVATNSSLPRLDGGNLYNIKPASVGVELTGSNSEHVTWNLAHTACSVTHSLNCYPVVTVWNSDGTQVYPGVIVTSGTAFTLDFQAAVDIGSGSPWRCVVSYGGAYVSGDDDGQSVPAQEETSSSSGSGGGSQSSSVPPPIVGTTDPDEDTVGVPGQMYYNSVSDAVFLCVMTAAGEAPGTTVYVWKEVGGGSDIDPDDFVPKLGFDTAVRGVVPSVTVIPAATTAYTLLDASSASNGHCARYSHAPASAPTYTLPAVSDTSVEHEVVIDVDFTNVNTLAFMDSGGYALSLQDDVEIILGDRWRFMCSYSYGMWMVFPMRLRNAVLIPDLPIEVSGTNGTELTTFSMPVVSSDGEVVTWSNASGLPSGLSLNLAGLLSGTPSESGTFACSATARAKYSPPLSVQFTITIS